MVFGKVASCLAFQFNLHGMNSGLFCEREKNFTFYFSRKTFVNFNEISRLQAFFPLLFPDSKCNLSPIFECISRRCRNVEHKKCWTRVEGECQQQSIMHEMQRKRVLGVKGFSFCIRVELRPCKPQLSKKTPEKVNETKKQTRVMQLTLLLYVAD